MVYSINWPEHLKHLEQVFSKLKKDQLFAKMSKFAFVVGSHQPGQCHITQKPKHLPSYSNASPW